MNLFTCEVLYFIRLPIILQYFSCTSGTLLKIRQHGCKRLRVTPTTSSHDAPLFNIKFDANPFAQQEQNESDNNEDELGFEDLAPGLSLSYTRDAIELLAMRPFSRSATIVGYEVCSEALGSDFELLMNFGRRGQGLKGCGLFVGYTGTFEWRLDATVDNVDSLREFRRNAASDQFGLSLYFLPGSLNADADTSAVKAWNDVHRFLDASRFRERKVAALRTRFDVDRLDADLSLLHEWKTTAEVALVVASGVAALFGVRYRLNADVFK
ncbi:hypothetical protein BC830DRAFT_552395 [Chytriomyces sp. MP71]|nr:hypothetical protein BC830DRAFT_552395 [Chytriomyces sp. MP71]